MLTDINSQFKRNSKRLNYQLQL